MRAGVVSPFDAPAPWRHQCRSSEGLRGCGNLSPIHSPHWLRLRHGDHGPLPRRPIFNDGVDGGPALAAGRTLEDGPLAAQQIWKASISAIWQKQNGSRFCKWWPVRKWKKTRKGKTSSQSHFLSLSLSLSILCVFLFPTQPQAWFPKAAAHSLTICVCTYLKFWILCVLLLSSLYLLWRWVNVIRTLDPILFKYIVTMVLCNIGIRLRKKRASVVLEP